MTAWHLLDAATIFRNIIEEDHFNSEYAVNIAARKYIELFENMDNDYLKERTIDLVDIAGRLSCVDVLIKDLHKRGIRLALGSSATRGNIEAVLAYFKLRDYFEVVVSGC